KGAAGCGSGGSGMFAIGMAIGMPPSAIPVRGGGPTCGRGGGAGTPDGAVTGDGPDGPPPAPLPEVEDDDDEADGRVGSGGSGGNNGNEPSCMGNAGLEWGGGRPTGRLEGTGTGGGS